MLNQIKLLVWTNDDQLKFRGKKCIFSAMIYTVPYIVHMLDFYFINFAKQVSKFFRVLFQTRASQKGGTCTRF